MSLTFSFHAYHHDTTIDLRYSRIPEECFGCPLDNFQREGCFNPQAWNFAPFEEKDEHTDILQREQIMNYPPMTFSQTQGGRKSKGFRSCG